MKEEIDKTATPCVYCGRLPNIIHYEADLWYYECSNKDCDKHHRYAYMGFRQSSAREQWEKMNRPIQRISTKKKGKHYEDDDL